jgi:hypothetical protein
MNTKQIISTIVVGGVLSIVPILGNAASLDTTTATPNDGVLQNFTGIDWSSNGSGWVQGFGLTNLNTTGDTADFTLTYQAFAATINTTSPTPNLFVASPGPAIGGYELTIYTVLQETATCLTANCNTISIATNSGTWDIFFDNAPNANQATGTGFLNGANIISGTWTAGSSIFSSAGGPIGPGAFGTGSASLIGTVLATNNAYVNPNLVGTDFQASLQFPGQSSPTYTRPAAFNGSATGIDTAQNFVLQADGSQSFTQAPQVPEPGIMMLLGAGILGLGFRKKLS